MSRRLADFSMIPAASRRGPGARPNPQSAGILLDF